VLLKAFRNHVLGLFIQGQSSKGQFAYIRSGFLVSYKNQLLWLSAGHVIDDLDYVLRSPDVQLGIVYWMDTYIDQAGPHDPVPFHYKHDPPRMRSWFSVGYDVGVMALKLLDEKAVLANPNILPFEHLHGISRHEHIAPTGNYVVGYPEGLVEHTRQQGADQVIHHKFAPNLACFPLLPIEPKDSNEGDGFWRHPEDLYADLLPFPDRPRAVIDSIVGMSGGPVIAFREGTDGGASVSVLGIQGGWLKSVRAIRSVRTAKVLELIDSWL
jgi:hypothetical protein